jgi:hypothetical protein
MSSPFVRMLIALLTVSSSIAIETSSKKQEIDVFVTTYNSDAMFTTSELDDKLIKDLTTSKTLLEFMESTFKDVATRIQNAAKAIAPKILGRDSTRRPHIVVIHFQEVVTCAGPKGLTENWNIAADVIELSTDPFREGKSSHKWISYFLKKLLENIGNVPAYASVAATLHLYGPMGTLIIRDTSLPIVVLHNQTVRFGETDYNILNKFGFKGSHSVTIRFTDREKPDLLFFNFHVSSKSFVTRRIQIQKIFRQSFKEYLEKNTENRSTVIFFSGDFNTRTGSNFKDVPDKDFFAAKNPTAKEFQDNCYDVYTSLLADAVHDLTAAYSFLINNDNNYYKDDKTMNCGAAFKSLLEVDEYTLWFKNAPDLLEKLSLCEGQNIKTVLEDSQRSKLGQFSPIKEAKPEFLPTFCLDKTNKKFGCEAHKNLEITSQTDRIFYAVRVSPQDLTKATGFWEVTPSEYTAHTAWFASDHGPVFSHFQIRAKGLNSGSPKADGWVPNPFIKTKCQAYMDLMTEPMKLERKIWKETKDRVKLEQDNLFKKVKQSRI